jgi:hypothetical protein
MFGVLNAVLLRPLSFRTLTTGQNFSTQAMPFLARPLWTCAILQCKPRLRKDGSL